MTNVFIKTPVYHGWRGDCARVNGHVLIRAFDDQAEEAVTIAMAPAQARALAQGIIAAADKAEAGE